MKPVLKLIAAAGLALLAACSGPPPPAGPPRAAGGAVAYSHCARTHGVPGFPDPASDGGIPKAVAQQLGVSDSRLQAAQDACRPLLPDATSFAQQTRQCLTTHSPPISGHLGECQHLDPAPAAMESN